MDQSCRARGARRGSLSVAVDFSYTSAIRFECASWWTVGRCSRTGTRKRFEQCGSDCAARRDCGKRIVTCNEFLICSSLRNHRQCGQYPLCFCRQAPRAIQSMATDAGRTREVEEGDEGGNPSRARSCEKHVEADAESDSS